MSEAFEVPFDDDHGLAEAVRRAARGAAPVNVVGDGKPVDAIVPPTEPDEDPDPAHLAVLEARPWSGEAYVRRHGTVTRRHERVDRFRTPLGRQEAAE